MAVRKALVLFVLGLAVVLLPCRAEAAAPDEDVVVVDDDEEEPAAEEEGPEKPEPVAEKAPVKKKKVFTDPDSQAKAEAERKKKKDKAKKERKAKKEKRKAELAKIPWFKRFAPENHILEAGFYIGGFFLSSNHNLFQSQEGPQPPLRRNMFDGGIRLGYFPICCIGVEFEVGGMPTRSSSEGRARLFTVRAHALAQLPYRLTPTLAIGGGGIGIRSDSVRLNDVGDAAFHWGPGVKFFVNEWIALRVDGRHIVFGPGNDSERVHAGEILFGISATLRLRRWTGKIRARRTDTDEDGYLDSYDECPNEYGEDTNGCPKNRDRDGDGVPDRNDKCPDEFGDGANGCPVPDKDGDGILDTEDQCETDPENFNGFEDKDGCPDDAPEEVKKLTGVIKGIKFASGKTEIRPQSRRTLNQAAATLEKYPDVRIRITGHTDDTGSRETNMSLSQARADSVKAYLVGRGVDDSRIETTGSGPDQPIADNKTKAGRAENRRIEFAVIP